MKIISRSLEVCSINFNYKTRKVHATSLARLFTRQLIIKTIVLRQHLQLGRKLVVKILFTLFGLIYFVHLVYMLLQLFCTELLVSCAQLRVKFDLRVLWQHVPYLNASFLAS